METCGGRVERTRQTMAGLAMNSPRSELSEMKGEEARAAASEASNPERASEGLAGGGHHGSR